MNDDIARTTAKYLSSKSREGVIVAAYADDKNDRLTVHIYQKPDEKRAEQIRSLLKSKKAVVCHRGEELDAANILYWKGGAA